MMATSNHTHHTPQTANEAADEVIALIKELHASTYQPLHAMLCDARRRFCQREVALFSTAVLQVGCGLSTLAQYAARLQEAAENKKYAPIFWSRVVYN